jgi:hypothetical protein
MINEQDTYDVIVYVIEALLNVSGLPDGGSWSIVAFHSIPGADKFAHHPRRLMGVKYGYAWNQSLAFSEKQVALEAIEHIEKQPERPFAFRLVEIRLLRLSHMIKTVSKRSKTDLIEEEAEYLYKRYSSRSPLTAWKDAPASLQDYFRRVAGELQKAENA